MRTNFRRSKKCTTTWKDHLMQSNCLKVLVIARFTFFNNMHLADPTRTSEGCARVYLCEIQLAHAPSAHYWCTKSVRPRLRAQMIARNRGSGIQTQKPSTWHESSWGQKKAVFVSTTVENCDKWNPANICGRGAFPVIIFRIWPLFVTKKMYFSGFHVFCIKK